MNKNTKKNKISIWNNPEAMTGTVIMCAIAAVFSLASAIINPYSGIFALVLSVCLVAVHISITSARYKKIARLSEDIDKILHGEAELCIEEFTEGELGILQSEIHKMTVRLKEQQYRLQSDKLYLANSLADISHQIKTPLTSINLMVSMLGNGELTQGQRKTLVRELTGLLYRIDKLISILLKISRLDAGTVEFKKEKVSLRDLVDQSLAPLLVPIELREQTIHIEAEGEFCGDLGWSAEAIGNIVKNCMEHTPNGGRISITADENPLFCRIIIKDNGNGIHPEDLPHIFERFYKGKNSDENSFGIGLALARMIIKEQNGTIKAENHPSGGAMFTIRFYK